MGLIGQGALKFTASPHWASLGELQSTTPELYGDVKQLTTQLYRTTHR